MVGTYPRWAVELGNIIIIVACSKVYSRHGSLWVEGESSSVFKEFVWMNIYGSNHASTSCITKGVVDF